MSDLISPERVIEAHKKNPNGFIYVDFDKKRLGKNNILYMDTYLREGEKNTRLNLVYNKEPITASVKSKDDRKSTFIQYRTKSSGKLGQAIDLIYTTIENIIMDEIKSKKNINVKGKKAAISLPIQRETINGDKLEDPIIRITLPFNENGKAKFKLSKVIKNEDTVKEVVINCTEDDVDTYFKNNTLTSGIVKMDCLMCHNFGISMPPKITSIMIKPTSNNNADLFGLMSAEELGDMVTEEEKNVEDDKEDDNEDDEEGNEDDEEDNEDGNDIESQLENLKNLAGN